MQNLTKEQLDRVRAVAMREVDAILAEMAAEEAKKAEWPKDGDSFISSSGSGNIHTWVYGGRDYDKGSFSLGNSFRPEHHPYLERQIEAQKVRAELMRQPGRSKGPGDWNVHWCFNGTKTLITTGWFRGAESIAWAIAGVWFESQEAIESAAKVVGLDRIKLYFDWYIDTDIEGCPR